MLGPVQYVFRVVTRVFEVTRLLLSDHQWRVVVLLQVQKALLQSAPLHDLSHVLEQIIDLQLHPLVDLLVLADPL